MKPAGSDLKILGDSLEDTTRAVVALERTARQIVRISMDVGPMKVIISEGISIPRMCMSTSVVNMITGAMPSIAYSQD